MKKDCKAIGCYDRYSCRRYDKTAEPTMYKLIIPENHNQGDEGCPSYQPLNQKEHATETI
jgi:hypothetical protein